MSPVAMGCPGLWETGIESCVPSILGAWIAWLVFLSEKTSPSARGWVLSCDETRLVAMGPEKLLPRQMAPRGKGGEKAAARPELALLLASFSASPPAS